jgi:hypothetical protein
MTVQTTTSRADYTGNGSTVAFTVPFYFLDNSHIVVYRTQISTGVVSTLALTTDYTASGAGSGSGGTVTCVTAPTTDQRISILRNVPLTQLTHYVDNDPFPAASHEKALDQLTMEIQQLNEAISRAVTLAAVVSGVSTALPTPVGNQVIGWNPGGTALTNIDSTTLGSNVTYGVTSKQTASGNAANKVFVLSSNGVTVNNVQVYISGVRQTPGTDYTLGADALTITFVTAPAAGTNNILFIWQQALAAGTPSDGSVSTAKIIDAAVTAAKLASGAAVSNIGFTPANDSAAAHLAGAETFTAAKRGAVVALTYAATITPDFSLGNNFSTTLTGNTTLANPTNLTAGQSGVITVTQDATGSRTMAFGSYFKFANGVAPTLTTTASAVDDIAYYVESSTRIVAKVIGAVA